MKKRKCAVCGDLVQTNVKLLWKRDSDGTVFNICMLCAELGKVNKDSVTKISMKSYTTYEEQASDIPQRRPVTKRVVATKKPK